MVEEAPRLRRYLLMGGKMYYASGGMDDLIDSFDSVAEASSRGNALLDTGAANSIEWWHVADGFTGAVVARSVDRPY